MFCYVNPLIKFINTELEYNHIYIKIISIIRILCCTLFTSCITFYCSLFTPSTAFGIIQFDVYALKSIRFDKYKGMVENNDVFKACTMF